MRYATVAIGLFVFSSTAFAQAPPCAPQEFTYDPYKPSDLAIVREYGGTVLAQAPLSTLLKLDPYVPSQGELLRQLGRGIPVWAAHPWYPLAAPRPVVPDCPPTPESSFAAPATPAAAPLTSLADVLTALERERGTATPATTRNTRLRRPGERQQGISITYEGRTWVSAGAAVPFHDADFMRIGESAGSTIFRRTDVKGDVIYVPTTAGMVAPFRAGR
jgi:hypothetical protein